jgi:hypothetical protein
MSRPWTLLPLFASVALSAACSVDSVADSSPFGASPSPPASSGGAGASGQYDGGASGSGGTSAGGTSASAELLAAGSFDLTLSSVSVAIAAGPASKTSPTEGSRLRVDLPATPTQKGVSWQAVVTQRWGEPRVFAVREEPGAIVLEGSLPVSSTPNGAGIDDILQSFRLVRDTQGRLTGVVSVRGQENVFSGDQGFTGELTAQGLLALDTTPPEARALNLGDLASDKTPTVFPWDAVGVSFAEPVDQAGALEAVRLTDAAGYDVGANLVTVPAGAEGASLGVSKAFGIFPEWDKVPAQLHLEAAPTYADPTGLFGAPLSVSYDVVSLPAAKSTREGFDAKSASAFTLLGAATSLGLTANDPLCETSGCVDLGAFSVSLCGDTASIGLSAGVAGRLLVPATAKGVSLRLRVLVADTVTAPVLKGAIPLSVLLVRPGGSAVTKDIEAPKAGSEMGAGGSTAADLVTSWTTVTLPLPEGSGELGVLVRAGSQFADPSCEAQAPSLGLETRVLLDSIAVE